MLRSASLVAVAFLPLTVLATEPQPAAPAPAAQPPAAQNPDPSADCVRETGTHIRNRDQRCLSVTGRSHSREHLKQTGEPDAGRALQHLDPSVSVGGG